MTFIVGFVFGVLVSAIITFVMTHLFDELLHSKYNEELFDKLLIVIGQRDRHRREVRRLKKQLRQDPYR